MKKLINLSEKGLSLLLVVVLTVLSTGVLSVVTVLADNNNTKILMNYSSNTLVIDTEHPDTLNFMDGTTLAGTMKVKIGDDYVTPSSNGIEIFFPLTQYSGVKYNVTIETEALNEYGYSDTHRASFDGNDINMSNGSNFVVEVDKDNMFLLDFSYELPCTENCGGGNNNNGENNDPIGGPMQMFPIVAYFGDDTVGVESQFDMIEIPSTWTGGDVHFKAKTCTVDTVVLPDNNDCVGTKGLMDVDIEGIINRDQIHQTVDGVPDKSHIVVKSDFFEYGKVSLHIMKGVVGQSISVVTVDMIDLTADSPIPISFGFGSAAVEKTIITNEVTNDLMIFFGNNETTLRAGGKRAHGITKVDGAIAVINDDGSATLSLPDYRVATTLDLAVTVKLDDNTTITRNVRVARTAVTLKYNAHDKKVFAGYAANKEYLYNNQAHNAGNFDAYLQVVLYKDDVVVGYKQIKIDDSFVDDLQNGQSDGIEATDTERATVVYTKDDTGVNKISVFLTNGKLDATKSLPSVEYGVGAGLTYTWEAEQ